jgi:hypothetical protein
MHHRPRCGFAGGVVGAGCGKDGAAKTIDRP